MPPTTERTGRDVEVWKKTKRDSAWKESHQAAVPGMTPISARTHRPNLFDPYRRSAQWDTAQAAMPNAARARSSPVEIDSGSRSARFRF